MPDPNYLFQSFINYEGQFKKIDPDLNATKDKNLEVMNDFWTKCKSIDRADLTSTSKIKKKNVLREESRIAIEAIRSSDGYEKQISDYRGRIASDWHTLEEEHGSSELVFLKEQELRSKIEQLNTTKRTNYLKDAIINNDTLFILSCFHCSISFPLYSKEELESAKDEYASRYFQDDYDRLQDFLKARYIVHHLCDTALRFISGELRVPPA